LWQLIAVFVAALCGCAVPEPVYPELLLPQDGRTGLIVLIHGSGDSPQDWPAELGPAITDQISEPSNWDLWSYDWQDDAAQRFVAAELGLLHGAHLGAVLAQEGGYREVHLLGHSVGAFVVHGVEQYLESIDRPIPVLHSTYLDPFVGLGNDWDYGELHFGETAVFAEAYFNRDDPVPSTNGAMDWAHNFDVTDGRPEDLSGRDGHWWPVRFYTESDGSGVAGMALTGEVADADLLSLHETWPRAEETILP